MYRRRRGRQDAETVQSQKFEGVKSRIGAWQRIRPCLRQGQRLGEPCEQRDVSEAQSDNWRKIAMVRNWSSAGDQEILGHIWTQPFEVTWYRRRMIIFDLSPFINHVRSNHHAWFQLKKKELSRIKCGSFRWFVFEFATSSYKFVVCMKSRGKIPIPNSQPGKRADEFEIL